MITNVLEALLWQVFQKCSCQGTEKLHSRLSFRECHVEKGKNAKCSCQKFVLPCRIGTRTGKKQAPLFLITAGCPPEVLVSEIYLAISFWAQNPRFVSALFLQKCSRRALNLPCRIGENAPLCNCWCSFQMCSCRTCILPCRIGPIGITKCQFVSCGECSRKCSAMSCRGNFVLPEVVHRL